MQPATSIDELVKAPVGRYLVGRCWLVWCASPALVGTVLWGRPSVEDAIDIERAWAFRSPLPGPLDMVTDLARIQAFDRLTFERVLAYAIRRRGELEQRVRRHVVVRPAGFDGAIVAGFSFVLSVSDRWRLTDNSHEAFLWLGAAQTSVRDEVEALARAATAEDHALGRIRVLLERDPRVTIEQVAQQLAVSRRSLQRQLREAGTSFRELVAVHRLTLARRLLEESDQKLAAIAEAVGLAGDGPLIRLFQERLGESPGDYRRRTRRPSE